MELRLLKVQGSGKEFFLLDETLLDRPLSEIEVQTLSANLCDRSNGLVDGADGLLLIQPSEREDTMNYMRAINRNGSEAVMCGNGLRAVGRYLSEKSGENNFLVETMHADLKVRQIEDIGESVKAFQIEVSPVSFLSQAIPMSGDVDETFINEKIPLLSEELLFTVVAVPNPQLISFVTEEQMASDIQAVISEKVNQPNALFPRGINVNFVSVLGDHQLYVRTYERGIGYTKASGTGICASSLAHVLINQGEFCEPILVKSPGGVAETVVHQDRDGSYWMELIGNATFSHHITLTLLDGLMANFDQASVKETKEEEAYQNFLKQVETTM